MYSMHTHFETEWLTGSLKNSFTVLASELVGPLNGSSQDVRPINKVIKHSYREGTGHLR